MCDRNQVMVSGTKTKVQFAYCILQLKLFISKSKLFSFVSNFPRFSCLSDRSVCQYMEVSIETSMASSTYFRLEPNFCTWYCSKHVNFHPVILISVSKMLTNNMCRVIIPNYSKKTEVLTVFSSFLLIQE